MVEEVGGTRASATSDSSAAMAEAARTLAAFDPDTIVIMSPHSPAISDAFAVDTAARYIGSLAQFGAPDLVLEYHGDPELANRILEYLDDAGIPAVDRGAVPSLASGELDHGVLVPMSFLDREARWPIVDLSLSYLPLDLHAQVGAHVAAAAESLGRRIAFVASGDCSHRLTQDAPAGYSPRAVELDQKLVELIEVSDFDSLARIDPELIEEGGECGLRSFVTLGGAAAPASARLLSYEGPWGVGYLTALVNESSATPASGAKGGAPGLDGHEIVSLARSAIDTYVREGRVLEPGRLHDADLPMRAGAFVSLHINGQLRGCIGTIAPVTGSLSEEVVRNAIEAATSDPRFPPVTSDELEFLDVKVDVLHEPEPCEQGDLDPSTYGVIVKSGPQRGLLLPDLEGVDTVEQQVAISRRKAGITPGEPVCLERFRVDRYA
jgi:AmmeMemoRadiSam system protein A